MIMVTLLVILVVGSIVEIGIFTDHVTHFKMNLVLMDYSVTKIELYRGLVNGLLSI